MSKLLRAANVKGFSHEYELFSLLTSGTAPLGFTVAVRTRFPACVHCRGSSKMADVIGEADRVRMRKRAVWSTQSCSLIASIGSASAVDGPIGLA